MRLCVPCVKAVVVKPADHVDPLPLIVALPTTVAPSRKFTVPPVRFADVPSAVVMVAFRETEPPSVEGLAELVTVVVVGTLRTTACVKTGDVLLA